MTAAPFDEPDGRNPVLLLAEAVATLPSFVRPGGRDALVRTLPPDIAAAVRQDGRPLIHSFSLVQACLDRPGGLAALLAALEAVEHGSAPMARVRAIAALVPAERWRGERR
ncbi:effector-associated domain 2-containing protein [Actinomadura parmotrematis]|uniref:Effector-associated domain-containing protein n=1 Tax=Actinomadura parmotrematis TaxID=2864039 RepID=A0ABS7G4R6_9ACTN|nr:hypothetical protein [Actinomadura parmotrematis]MBW8486849.1 hypothetical protein [Actinomadura parmotrematis]